MSLFLLILVTYLGLLSLAVLVFGHSIFLLWVLSNSGEGSLPETTRSYASKLALAFYSLKISVYMVSTYLSTPWDLGSGMGHGIVSILLLIERHIDSNVEEFTSYVEGQASGLG